MSRWFWTAECQYPDRKPFLLSAIDFFIEAELHEEALDQLQELLGQVWARISPHEPPRIIAVHRGFLTLYSQVDK